ncbi:hypothetical protein BamIOP4010DRAFT_6501 [Burkholderia ambifaria IOP40-10]|uniref:Uncharacterized protein n=1 Tax=Burkholderia ambifaria IOP40-10 TaxID=396596 RepID=B1FR40_9BURK|nr:hypothetical protein [Burkholderia ambifaria]EDS99981.1 hypothetical protein BamIOP4010DRAFT_6501 [Burkholderia ambifaria IOP40-10]
MTQLKVEFETLGLQVPTAQPIERMRHVSGCAATGPIKRARWKIV